MQKYRFLIFALVALALPYSYAATEPYFPSKFEWQTLSPQEAGFDAEKLQAAVELALQETVLEPNNIHQLLLDTYTAKEPNYRVLGPTKPRVTAAGMVVKSGKIVAQWGDTKRVDMTFSVVKSYLSALVGIAIRDKLIASVHDPVVNYVRDGKFDSEKNRAITWHHLLQQTSDWQGTLWDIHDWADRPVGDSLEEWKNRPLYPAGTHYKYNDVRVNLLAFALMEVFRDPLPTVLKREVMDKVNASSTWRWYGYENSWVELDGQRVQSVSGGGHFGGGMFINTEDHARFGLLFLRNGVVNQKQVIPAEWITQSRVPSDTKSDYGYLWWLNNEKNIENAPHSAYLAAGFGGNYIYVDEVNDLVIVLRWIPNMSAVVNAFIDALSKEG